MENGVPLKPYTSITFFFVCRRNEREYTSSGNEGEVQEREKGEKSLKASSRRGKNFA